MLEIPSQEEPILAIDIAYSGWQGVVEASKEQIAEAVRLVIERISHYPVQYELSIVFANDETVQKLNRDYRHKDQPTNILSFPQIDRFSDVRDMPSPVMLGDLVLSWETISFEAVSQEKVLIHHVLHLVVHGVMHLLGFDHMTELEADEMEKIEIDILKQLHIPNPYL